MDTPLAESGIIGTAVGAAVVGLRPICEMQFADFVSCGFDQLVNVAGKMYYRQGLPVNITVRLPSGGGFSRRAVPLAEPRGVVHARARAEGRRAVDGATTPRACSISAIRDHNPVVFLEHKHLYRRVKGEVPDGALRDAVHRARRARGHRPDGRRLRRDGPHGARGDRGPRRRLGRGARPALARAARRGGDPRHRAQDLEGADRRRGQRDVRRRRAGRRGRRRARRSRTSTGRCAASRRPTCRSRSRPRSSRRCCRASTACRRPPVSSSSTEAGTSTLVDVVMPQMGVSVSEGTIVEWRKQVGDWVAYEEAICDISTDKIDTEVPSPAAGRLAEIVVEVGTTVDVGTVLARLATDARPGEPHASEGDEAAREPGRLRRRARARPRRPRARRRCESTADPAHAPATATPADAPQRPPLLAGRDADRGRARRRPRAGPGHRSRRARAQAGRARVPGGRRRRRARLARRAQAWSRRCTSSRPTGPSRRRPAAGPAAPPPVVAGAYVASGRRSRCRACAARSAST